jgi:hypothetical protein
VRAELIECLFPDGLDAAPRLTVESAQSRALCALGQAYQLRGEPGAAVRTFRRTVDLDKRIGMIDNLPIDLNNLGYAQRLSGGLYSSEVSHRAAMGLSRSLGIRFDELRSLLGLGLNLSARNCPNDERALNYALAISVSRHDLQSEALVTLAFAGRALWQGDPASAMALADRASELAAHWRVESELILVSRLQGTAALALADLVTADERLHQALARARACNLVQEELPTLIALAELYRCRGESTRAREALADVWDAAERGPFPLFHADGLNVLAQIERDSNDRDRAVEAALEGLRKAWCDGPPFAYHWGLIASRRHLAELNAAEPETPPFNPPPTEPMPNVEIGTPYNSSGKLDPERVD